MIKTYTIFLVLIAVVIHDNSYSQTNTGPDFTILVLSETPMFMDVDTLQGASLTENEISVLVDLSDNCLQRWNAERPIKYLDGHNGNRKLEDYYKQFLPTYNKSGDKSVWINFIKKSDIKELPKKLFVSTDNPHYYNCWVNLNELRILK
jgi:hypothetical protein